MANTEIVRKAVDAFNRHDAAGFASQYAEDAVVYDPYYPEPLRGRSAVRKDIEDFFRAFPDVSNALKLTMSEGNIVAAEIAVKGVHSGPLALPSGEIPATGKTMSFEGGLFARLNGQGLIVEEHRYFDVAGQLTQLGLMA